MPVQQCKRHASSGQRINNQKLIEKTKIFNFKLNLSNFVKFTINNSIKTFLIDTGADISVIKISQVNEINKRNVIKISGITQGCESTLGTSNLTVFHNHFAFEKAFHVVEDNFPIPTDGLLGMDFFNKFSTIINYDNFTLSLNLSNKRIYVPINNHMGCNTLLIPPRSEVYRIVPNIILKEDAVVSNAEIADGVFIAGSIIDKNFPVVRLLNVNIEPAIIHNIKINCEPLSNFEIATGSLPSREQTVCEIISSANSHIHKDVKNNFLNLINKYTDVFACENEKLTTNNFYKQELRLFDTTPVYVRNYKIPHIHKQEIQAQVDKLKNDGIIEESCSNYNSPIILVPKKPLPGSNEKRWRLVVDFRQLNKKLVSDVFPIPRIDDILDQLGRAKWFSVLDLQSGFHQIELDPNSRDYTSFSSNLGSYRFTRMPFGLKVAPNSFARMMQMAFSGLPPDSAFLYMDDIIVIGCSEKHHLANLESVFKVARRKNLKLNPQKCVFFKQEVTYLGHKCTNKGIQVDDTKYKIIADYPVPRDANEVKRFVAFCNYYRRFVKNFAEITGCLNKLTKKNQPFIWTVECQEAFNMLKTTLMNPPILQYPNFNKTFILSTDASNLACGAILSQAHGNIDLPIAYASKGFTLGESNKSTIEKELTAIHWAINYFRPYLYGQKFIIKTDHKPLVYLYSLKNPSSKLTRMRLDLDEYDYIIEYIKGKDNVGADALSRLSADDLKSIRINNMCILNVQTRAMTKNKINKNNAVNDDNNNHGILAKENKQPKVYEVLDNTLVMGIPHVKFFKNGHNFRIVIQRKNKILASNIIQVFDSKGNLVLEQVLAELEQLCKNLRINDIKVYLNEEIFKNVTVVQLKKIGLQKLKRLNIILCRMPIQIINESKQREIISQFHNNPLTGGHTGIRKTLMKVKSMYAWKNQRAQIIDFINNCRQCKLNKHGRNVKSPLVITETPQLPFDIVQIDTVGPLPATEDGFKYAITMQCQLTKYIITAAIKDKDAKSIAKAIYDAFILIYGPMKVLITDKGTEYVNSVISELTNLLGIEKRVSTSYHHETVGSIERNHRELNVYFRIYLGSEMCEWNKWLPTYTFCYNTTPNITHGFTPYELVYGKKVNLADSFGSVVEPLYNVDNFNMEMKYRLQTARQRAQKYIKSAKENQKISFDKNSKPISLKAGDKIKITNPAGHKFDSCYSGPFTITKLLDNNNVEIVNDSGARKIIHRNRVHKF